MFYYSSTASGHHMSSRLKDRVEASFSVGPDAEAVSFEAAKVWAGSRSMSIGDKDNVVEGLGVRLALFQASFDRVATRFVLESPIVLAL